MQRTVLWGLNFCLWRDLCLISPKQLKFGFKPFFAISIKWMIMHNIAYKTSSNTIVMHTNSPENSIRNENCLKHVYKHMPQQKFLGKSTLLLVGGRKGRFFLVLWVFGFCLVFFFFLIAEILVSGTFKCVSKEEEWTNMLRLLETVW